MVRGMVRLGAIRRRISVLLGAAVLALGIGWTATIAQSSWLNPPAVWTGSDATPAFRALKGQPISPASAGSQFSATSATDGLCRDFSANASICPGGVRPRAPEITALARALENDPDLIYEYVRNRIDTEFQFGLAKGEVGTVINGSGTPFDQARLLVELLRQAGYTANYRFGDITLTGTQVEQWTGFSNAKAVCDFLAGGGIPATVNGLESSCSASGQVNSAVISHVWVAAVIDGQTVQLDPSFKPYRQLTRVDVRSIAALPAGDVYASATTSVSRTNGGTTTQGYNGDAIANRLNTATSNLGSWLGQAENRGLTMDEVVGGRRIVWAALSA